MSEITLKHGPDFQRHVIHRMISDRAFCAKACQHLKDDFFSGELSWFFRKVREHFEEYKTNPSGGEIREKLNHQKDSARYEAELELILSANSIGREFLNKEITAFIQANIFVSSVREGADLYNAGDRRACYDFIKDRMAQLYEADFESDKLVHFGDAEEVMRLAAAQSKDAVPTAIRVIDDAMHGGMMPQTWTTFLGGSNVGKSMLCPNLAKAACLEKRKKTLVFVHEDEDVPTKLRYLSCFSGIAYNRLLLPRHDLSSDELALIEQADQILKEHVTMRFMYGKESFIEDVTEQARRVMDQWPYHLFLDDYGQCLKIRSFKAMEDRYTANEYIYQELKQICLELNVAGAGGAQTNRTGHRINANGSDFLRCADVGDSWGIIKKSSNVITMNRSEANKQNNRIVFLLDKVRNGRCPVAVECVSDFSCARTHLTDEANVQTEIPIKEET